MSERSYLEEISIRNLGIIDQSSLVLGRGLNVLTGETGAGKTMILTALSLVLGGKSDSSLVRRGADRLIATAQFSIPLGMASSLAELDATVEDGSLVLTRSVTEEGKSRASCGGATVSATVLAEIGESLIEIHGQSANSQIVKPTRQRELLDRFAGEKVVTALNQYQNIYSAYLDIKERLQAMTSSANKRGSEIAELEEFLTAWQKLKAVRNEYSQSEGEISRLSSVEDLRVAATGALAALAEEAEGVLTLLGSARQFLDSAKMRDPKLAEIADRLNESFFLAEDVAHELSSYCTSLEADPDRLQYLQERKAAINSFIKRWAGAGDQDAQLIELAGKAKSAKSVIADLQGGDDRIVELTSELAGVKSELLTAAQKLSGERINSAILLSQEVSEEIHALAMPHTQFEVKVRTPDYQGPLKESDFTTLGCDEITMVIQGHKDGPLVALGKGASGGEMSRIMLALEVVIAKSHPVGTYIFDEVDAGVGGKAAIEVGRRLHTLAKHSQVIVVTHLPQVAAWGGTHFVVRKSSDGSIVQSGVEEVSGSARIEEIARMLAGLEESVSAREHASELLALPL